MAASLRHNCKRSLRRPVSASLSASVWVFALARRAGRVWSYQRVQQVANKHTHSRTHESPSVNFLRSVINTEWVIDILCSDYTQSAWITKPIEARQRPLGLSSAGWKTQPPWSDVKAPSGCCHGNLSLRMLHMPHHFQLLRQQHTYTHQHITDECLEVGSSCNRTRKVVLLHTKTNSAIRACVCFFSLFPF